MGPESIHGKRKDVAVDSNEIKAGFWSRHRRLKWVLGVSAAALAVFSVVLLILARRAEPLLRSQIVQALEDHFHAHVELDSFHIALRDGLRAEGKGLRIWQPVATEGKTESSDEEPPALGNPLIQIEEFRFHAPLKYDSGKPIRITTVQLKGLIIDVPPRHKFKQGFPSPVGGNKSRATVPKESTPLQPAPSKPRLVRFLVESLECRNSRLTLETDKPGKLPMVFDIAHLKLTGVQPDEPVAYEADLTNPRPTGIIHTHGKIGPWNAPDPGETSLNGDYRFEHADLGDFKGIAGMLTSIGNYKGTLRDLTVDGETSVPDFQLDRFGTPVPLYTRFHALVDGTNGDTQLQPVDAMLDHSHFQVRGQVVRATAEQNGTLVSKGHQISLSMDIDRGHAEDFLKLVAHSGIPFFTGEMSMKGRLEIPPGTESMQDRIKLNGVFSLADVRFTSANVQNRVSELSMRGQGNARDSRTNDSSAVRSTMTGDFRMADGVINLPTLEYTVPGAVVNLKGTYGVDSGAIAFEGIAKMEATVSQIVGGWKGFLLKPVDRFFKKGDAGTQVPIYIRGTRDNPQFGIDLNRMKNSAPQRPSKAH
jgi:hypothetical protein